MSRKLAVAVGATLIAAFSPAIAQAASVGGVDNAAGAPRAHLRRRAGRDQPADLHPRGGERRRPRSLGDARDHGRGACRARTPTRRVPRGAPAITSSSRSMTCPTAPTASPNVATRPSTAARARTPPGSDVPRRIDGPATRTRATAAAATTRSSTRSPTARPTTVRRTGRRRDQRQLGQRRAPRRGGQRHSASAAPGPTCSTAGTASTRSPTATAAPTRRAASPSRSPAARATGAGAPGENDKLAGVENLQGTGRTTRSSATTDANTIQGLGGDDTITGGKGVDLLYGGARQRQHRRRRPGRRPRLLRRAAGGRHRERRRWRPGGRMPGRGGPVHQPGAGRDRARPDGAAGSASPTPRSSRSGPSGAGARRSRSSRATRPCATPSPRS